MPRLRVLLIDDEKDIFECLKSVVTKIPPLPVDLIYSSALDAGMELALETRPDVVLLDLHFTDDVTQREADYDRTAKAISMIWAFSQISAVVIFSGVGTAGLWSQCACQGALDFLPKSVFIDPDDARRAELMRCMWNAINVRKALKHAGFYDGRLTSPSCTPESCAA